MARSCVEFRLSMPGVASWDGRWSGAGRNYVIYRDLSEADVARLGVPKSWTHAWGDGWCAQVAARVLAVGERRQKSDGFCGYDWMVDFILRWGDTRCRCEWAPDPSPPSPEGEWERCAYCGTSRMTDGSRVAGALMEWGGA